MFCLFVGTILMIISVTRFTIVRQASSAHIAQVAASFPPRLTIWPNSLQVQLGYERSRASELIHLLRLLLLVISVWLNNGTLPSLYCIINIIR
jgi:hypothetical protein